MIVLDILPPGQLFGALVAVGALCGLIAGYLVFQDIRRYGGSNGFVWGFGITLLFLVGVVPGVIGLFIYIMTRDTTGGRRGTAG